MRQRPLLSAITVHDASPSEAFHRRLSALVSASQSSKHVFTSPLGPFSLGGSPALLPRIAFFGPHASDESWRLAILAGFDSRDLRSSHAVLGLLERLAAHPDSGRCLHLALFPIVDAGGLYLGATGRGLAGYHWGRRQVPEIDLLEKDARQRSYHGFIRIEQALPGEEHAAIQLRTAKGDPLSPDVELLSTEDIGDYPGRFESSKCSSNPISGPLSVADDLPHTPFEITIRIPGSHSADPYTEDAVVDLIHRFLWRYRAFQAYGMNL